MTTFEIVNPNFVNFPDCILSIFWAEDMPAQHENMNFRKFQILTIFDQFMDVQRCADDVIRHLLATSDAAGAGAAFHANFFLPIRFTFVRRFYVPKFNFIPCLT